MKPRNESNHAQSNPIKEMQRKEFRGGNGRLLPDLVNAVSRTFEIEGDAHAVGA